MRIPTGGDPGSRPRKPIRVNVSAAAHVRAPKVGGRRPDSTISAMVVTEANPVNIKIIMMRVNNFVEEERVTSKTDEVIPCSYSSLASARDFASVPMFLLESVHKTWRIVTWKVSIDFV